MDALTTMEKASCTGYMVPASVLEGMQNHDGVRLNNDASLVDAEVLRKAHRLCKQFLGGAWSRVTLSKLRVQPISGGLSNHLYLCQLPASEEIHGQEPREVVLRIYGQILQENMSALLIDSVVFSLLSEKGLGPRLYGVFPGGRIEQFIPSRSLRTKELALPHLSVQIARKMAHFHSLSMPISKDPSFMFDTMDKWCREMNSVLASDGYDMTQHARIDSIERMRIAQEIPVLLKAIKAVKSPVVLSHNDLQEGNILIRDLVSAEGDESANIMCIDFEYCSYNYRGFDLANHFNEWCYDYTLEHFPFYAVDRSAYPSSEQQTAFVRAYIDEWNSLPGHEACRILSGAEGEQQLMREARVLSLLSHLFWGLWSVVQIHKSSIQFGYLDYALLRFEDYFQAKKNLPQDILDAIQI